MTEEEIKQMNKTARGKGIIGSNAIMPRYILNKDWLKARKMLDFGSGKACIQTNMLRDIHGCNVQPYDIGDNFIPGIHLEKDEFTKDAFQLVFASNVVNVQPNEECLLETLRDMFYFVEPEIGICIFNFPSEPRKMEGLTKEDLIRYAAQVFPTVMAERYDGHMIFSCTKES